ncbi:MAG: hypothetical protein WCJ74_01340 [bacterium]
MEANTMKLQIEILLYFVKNGVLHVLLNRYGHMSMCASEREAREGFYRPTICCEEDNKNFATLFDATKRELGDSISTEVVPIIHGLTPVEHSTKTRFIALVSQSLVEKFRLPFNAGGLIPISQIEVLDVVELPAQNLSININRYPMVAGHGWKDFLSTGFELLSAR